MERQTSGHTWVANSTCHVSPTKRARRVPAEKKTVGGKPSEGAAHACSRTSRPRLHVSALLGEARSKEPLCRDSCTLALCNGAASRGRGSGAASHGRTAKMNTWLSLSLNRRTAGRCLRCQRRRSLVFLFAIQPSRSLVPPCRGRTLAPAASTLTVRALGKDHVLPESGSGAVRRAGRAKLDIRLDVQQFEVDHVLVRTFVQVEARGR